MSTPVSSEVYNTDDPTVTVPKWNPAVTHIDLNSHGEAVKQFFLSLAVDPEGSVVELNGHAVARVIPTNGRHSGSPQGRGPWTDAKNTRRCALVDREIDGMLSPEEAVELESLQQQMLQERRRLAPVALDDLRRLHQEMLTKAQEQSGEGGA